MKTKVVDFERLFDKVMEDMFQPSADKINHRLNKEEKNWSPSNKDGKYKCIYFNNRTFACLLNEVKSYLHDFYKNKFPTQIEVFDKIYNLKFLDVGCGAGQKVYLANKLEFNAYGLEYHKEFVKEAIRLLYLADYRKDSWNHSRKVNRYQWKNKIIHGDALTFQEYKNFDIIYFYRPIRDEIQQRKLELKVAENAAVNSIVLAVYNPALFTPFGGTTFADNQKLLEQLGWKYMIMNSFAVFQRMSIPK